MSSTTMQMSPADILKYQNDLVRTGKFEPLGKMQKIAIGPNAAWAPRGDDPIMAKIGRFIELRDRPLPIAQSPDRSMLLLLAPLVDPAGYVTLPDLPNPTWTPPNPTKEEIEGIKVMKKGPDGKMHETREFPKDSPRLNVPMIKQNLVDRAEGYLEGTNFLVFSPVERITFQPEISHRMVGDAWLIVGKPDPATHTKLTLLIDQKTGEMHFFGGRYEIIGSSGIAK